MMRNHKLVEDFERGLVRDAPPDLAGIAYMVIGGQGALRRAQPVTLELS